MRRNGRMLRGFATAALGAFISLPAAMPAGAVDLSGMTLLAHASEQRMRANTQRENFTTTLEIYFGTKGNRFVVREAARGTVPIPTAANRVLVPAGADKGSKRRKDGNFTLVVHLRQSANSIQIRLESRGKDTRYANETYIYEVSLGNGTCRITNFRYLPDARLNYGRTTWSGGECTLTQGPPAGLSDES